jgi:hypothetical protein
MGLTAVRVIAMMLQRLMQNAVNFGFPAEVM